MRLFIKKKTSVKVIARLKKRVRIRKVVQGTAERPRLCVFRSNCHMYAQLVDDTKQMILATASTLKMTGVKCNKEAAKRVGADIAKLALEKKLSNVVFDRGGYLYHGRIKALADAAREAGLKF